MSEVSTSPTPTEAPAFAPPEASKMLGTTLTDAYANPQLSISNLKRAEAQHNIAEEKGFLASLADESLQQNILEAESRLSPEELKKLNQKIIGAAAVHSTVEKPVYVPRTPTEIGQVESAAVREPSAAEKALAARDAQSAVFRQQIARHEAGETWPDIQTPAKMAEVR